MPSFIAPMPIKHFHEYNIKINFISPPSALNFVKRSVLHVLHMQIYTHPQCTWVYTQRNALSIWTSSFRNALLGENPPRHSEPTSQFTKLLWPQKTRTQGGACRTTERSLEDEPWALSNRSSSLAPRIHQDRNSLLITSLWLTEAEAERKSTASRWKGDELPQKTWDQIHTAEPRWASSALASRRSLRTQHTSTERAKLLAHSLSLQVSNVLIFKNPAYCPRQSVQWLSG